MKYLLILSCLIITSCEQRKFVDSRSQSQIQFGQRLNRYDTLYGANANDIGKKQLRDTFLNSINRYLVDTCDFLLKDFRVKVEEIGLQDIAGFKAFHAKFKDRSGNVFWMEFDYKPELIRHLDSNSAYKLLKNMPTKIDTTLSFFYLGDIDWDGYSNYDRAVSLKVVPFLAGTNFDSLRIANKKNKPKHR